MVRHKGIETRKHTVGETWNIRSLKIKTIVGDPEKGHADVQVTREVTTYGGSPYSGNPNEYALEGSNNSTASEHGRGPGICGLGGGSLSSSMGVTSE